VQAGSGAGVGAGKSGNNRSRQRSAKDKDRGARKEIYRQWRRDSNLVSSLLIPSPLHFRGRTRKGQVKLYCILLMGFSGAEEAYIVKQNFILEGGVGGGGGAAAQFRQNEAPPM
jgi:hypothetical protein